MYRWVWNSSPDSKRNRTNKHETGKHGAPSSAADANFPLKRALEKQLTVAIKERLSLKLSGYGFGI